MQQTETWLGKVTLPVRSRWRKVGLVFWSSFEFICLFCEALRASYLPGIDLDELITVEEK